MEVVEVKERMTTWTCESSLYQIKAGYSIQSKGCAMFSCDITLYLHVLLLSLVAPVFWCMGSACRIHLHANFLNFLLRQTFTVIHILCFWRQTQWTWIKTDLRVSLWCVCVSMCVCACLTGWQRVTNLVEERKGGSEEDSPCLKLWSSFISSHMFFVSNLISPFRSSRKFLHLWFQAPLFSALVR